MNKQTLGPQGLTIDLPPLFIKYLDAAIVRLRMHYPALVFSGNDRGIIVTGDTDIDPEILRSAVLHIVYREKIYAETLTMRQSLLTAVMR
ncbi:hypothetical protein [Candidatus Phyllobacterium onerii]|uniref:hypothetical protein n=1 Tax=Candidatus Phyllobacterium onerii TaxID=3020828 RepID=UPI002330F5EE|nr:hypothetical protein [Phyllobacterium sp. IY22]